MGQVQAQRAAFGTNVLTEQGGAGAWAQFFRQFADITVIALIVAAGIALLLAFVEGKQQSHLERFGNAGAIGAIVILNAVIGFFQERKAESALRALRDVTAPVARVIRDGAEQMVPASEVVPGDIMLLKQGDRVVADGRLIHCIDLLLTESALTGESNPVDKQCSVLTKETVLAERTNMVFAGTHVNAGRARALAVATGMQSELGRIAGMLGQVRAPETPLQLALRRFGTHVVIGCGLVGLVVFAIGLLRLNESIGFLLLTGVSLAVAAIPEGLPAVTTIVLALGVERMARRKALVRRLSAVETLGAAHVICTDKTGTLTQNRMAVRRLWAGGKTLRVQTFDDSTQGWQLMDDDNQEVCPAGAVAELLFASQFAPAAKLNASSGSLEVQGDPTDAALLALYAEFGARLEPQGDPEVLRELPFDGHRKMAAVIVSTPSGLQSYIHGAAEKVLDHVVEVVGEDGVDHLLERSVRAELLEVIERWARTGLRVLALARRRPTATPTILLEARPSLVQVFERDLTLIGLVGMADPPRGEVRSAIEVARRAGVKSIMITGDHPATARAIGSEIGLLQDDDEVISGAELEQMSDADLARRLPAVRAVARATAASKLRLVQALTQSGRVVAMTGDGVNDAPAIKAANIGIAMGRTGTDVAREAADMVLADDNYATIVSAIEEGRIIYSNIKRFIVFLFAANAGLVLAVFIAAMLGWPAILTPTQILWINLITNGLPALALGMEPMHVDPMSEPPREQSEPFLAWREVIWLVFYGGCMALLGLLVFGHYLASAGEAPGESVLRSARSMTFTVLAFSPLFHALNSRSRSRSVFALGLASNWRLLGAFVAAAALQSIAIYVPFMEKVFGTAPLSGAELGAAMAMACSVWVIGEVSKLVLKLAGKLAGKEQQARAVRGRESTRGGHS
jgi:Ca2+-transporting ATPase